MNVLPQFLEEEPEPLKEEIDEPEDDDETISDIGSSEVMPEVIKPKPRSTMEDIYGDGPVMKVVEEEKPKKERKKRKPMTDEQKEKLALARQKALEVRREKAKEKQELKDLQKMKKQKEINDLRAEVGLEPKKKKEPEPKKEVIIKEPEKIEVQPTMQTEKYYTQADLDKATLNAIMGYETIRKDRKAKKNEMLAKKREEQRVAEQLRKVIQPRNITYGQEGYFNDCF